MKLRTKFAIVLAVILVVIGGVIFGGLEIFKQSAITETEENVQDTAKDTARLIGERITQQKDHVTLIAQRPGASDFENSSEFLRSYLLMSSSAHNSAELIWAENRTVIDIQGQLEEGRREKLIGETADDTRCWEQVTHGSPCVGKVERDDRNPADPEDDVHFAAIYAPIYEPGVLNTSEREVIAVFAAPIRVGTFTDVTAPLETQNQSVTVIANGTAINRAERTFTSATNASAEVDVTGWTVEVSRNRAPLNERLGFLAQTQGLSMLLVVLAVVGFGVWDYRSNLAQTQKLLAGFQEIKAGNYGYSLELAAAEEWQQISDGFNDLATGLAEREAALKEREQRLEVLYRVLRHNLRNEMSVILNYADIITDMADETEIVEEAGQTILNTGNKLANLSDTARQIENALESAEEGNVEQSIEDFLPDLIDEYAEEYPDAEIEVAEMPDDTSISAISALRLAAENVLENACRHSDKETPEIEIACYPVEDGDRLRLEFRDNGPGIPEQERNVLREGRETALEHGSGLGLWLVYWVMDKSDAYLFIGDNEPEGAIVSFDLLRPPARSGAQGATGEVEA